MAERPIALPPVKEGNVPVDLKHRSDFWLDRESIVLLVTFVVLTV